MVKAEDFFGVSLVGGYEVCCWSSYSHLFEEGLYEAFCLPVRQSKEVFEKECERD